MNRNRLFERYANETGKKTGWLRAYLYGVLPIVLLMSLGRAINFITAQNYVGFCLELIVCGVLAFNFWLLFGLDGLGYVSTLVAAGALAARHLYDCIALTVAAAQDSTLAVTLIAGLFVYGAIFAALVLHAIYFVRRKSLFYDFSIQERRQTMLERRRDKHAAAGRAEAHATPPTPAAEKHEFIKIRVAGVTYDTDGISRQTVLRKIKFGDAPFDQDGEVDVRLREYMYNGEPAIGVYVNDFQVGNVPRDRVAYILDNWERIDRLTDFRVTGGGYAKNNFDDDVDSDDDVYDDADIDNDDMDGGELEKLHYGAEITLRLLAKNPTQNA